MLNANLHITVHILREVTVAYKD